ncbi:hypothetical protein V5F59_18625 [Xanthobacter autotrophicus DSM 431]|uniref:COG4223 family protein n=1 Tax=Xanthobacter nonsaccharivorans TaxID=3119912 RepID=UPI00372C4BBA
MAAEGNTVEAAPVSAEQAAEAAIEEPAKPAAAAAPARSGSGAGAVFAALLAGAVAGGGVAGGLWYAMGALTPPPAAAPKPVVDLAPLQNRIAALEARPTADAGAIAALTARLEKSEAALKALESTVAALKGAPAAAAAAQAAPAVPPSLLKSVEDLKAAAEATRTALAAATKEIETVRAAQASFQSAIATASGGAQQALTQAQQASAQVQQATTQSQAVASRLDAVGPRLDALKKQIEDASAAATQFNRAAAGLVVLSTFREAVVSGRPFATELGAAKATLGANAAQLDAFAAIAPDGFAPPAKLAERLAKEGAAAIGAAAPPPADAPVSLVDRLMASAESLVKVRPASGPGAVDAESVLATAVGLVKTGQLDEALRVLKQLPDAVQARLAVVRDIEARASALRLAGMLYQQQLAAISGKMP